MIYHLFVYTTDPKMNVLFGILLNQRLGVFKLHFFITMMFCFKGTQTFALDGNTELKTRWRNTGYKFLHDSLYDASLCLSKTNVQPFDEFTFFLSYLSRCAGLVAWLCVLIRKIKPRRDHGRGDIPLYLSPHWKAGLHGQKRERREKRARCGLRLASATSTRESTLDFSS